MGMHKRSAKKQIFFNKLKLIKRLFTYFYSPVQYVYYIINNRLLKLLTFYRLYYHNPIGLPFEYECYECSMALGYEDIQVFIHLFIRTIKRFVKQSLQQLYPITLVFYNLLFQYECTCELNRDEKVKPASRSTCTYIKYFCARGHNLDFIDVVMNQTIYIKSN